MSSRLGGTSVCKIQKWLSSLAELVSLNFRVFIKAVRMIFLNFHNNKLYYILFLSIKKQQKPTWLGKIQSHFRVVVNSLVGRSVRRISLFSLWKEKKQCQWCLVLPFVISGRVLCYIIICTFLYVWNRSKLKVKIKRNWTGIMNKKKKRKIGVYEWQLKSCVSSTWFISKFGSGCT